MAVNVNVSKNDDPQVVIERLARKRISEEDASRYFTERIERNQDRSVPKLIVDAVRKAFQSSR